MVGGRPQKAAPQRIRSLFVIRPLDRSEPTGLSGEARVLGTGPAAPGPCSGCRRQQPNTEELPAVPEAVYPLTEAGTAEVHPNSHIRVRIRIAPGSGERQLLLLPDVNRVSDSGCCSSKDQSQTGKD